VKCVFTVNRLRYNKKNGFSWLVVLPKPTRELLLQAQLLGTRQHNIKKAANMSVLWENLVLNYSDILCGKTSSLELPGGGFTVFLLTSEEM
jgi:hypothetical protein